MVMFQFAKCKRLPEDQASGRGKIQWNSFWWIFQDLPFSHNRRLAMRYMEWRIPSPSLMLKKKVLLPVWMISSGTIGTIAIWWWGQESTTISAYNPICCRGNPKHFLFAVQKQQCFCRNWWNLHAEIFYPSFSTLFKWNPTEKSTSVPMENPLCPSLIPWKTGRRPCDEFGLQTFRENSDVPCVGDRHGDPGDPGDPWPRSRKRSTEAGGGVGYTLPYRMGPHS